MTSETNYLETIDKLCKAGLDPSGTIVQTQKATGKELIGCFPIHTPEEIIYAANCVPIGMWGGRTEIQLADRYLQSFCCSIMRTNMEFGIKKTYNMLRAAVIPTFCDTLKCVLENWKVAVPDVPAIAIVYPQNRKIKAGIDYTVSELKRVKKEIEKLLHIIITDEKVEEAFALYEEYRRTMREFTEVSARYPHIISAKKRHLIIKAGEFMDKAYYTKKIREIIDGLNAEPACNFSGVRTIVTGLIPEPVEILDIFNENNIAVVGDDLSLGSRKWRTPAREEGDAYLKMAYMIADMSGDTFLYEEKKSKGQMLIDLAQKNKAQAVIVFMMKFCDPEEYDYPIYKEELKKAGITELYLEVDQQMASFEQMRTRIQSFAEMLL